MEPLLAPDWLKDYDPLFDMFDEEMRANGQSLAAAAASYDAMTDYDLYQYYPSKPPATLLLDDSTLNLGFEWMPYLESNSCSSPPPQSTSYQQVDTRPHTASKDSNNNVNTATSCTVGASSAGTSSLASPATSSVASSPPVSPLILHSACNSAAGGNPAVGLESINCNSVNASGSGSFILKSSKAISIDINSKSDADLLVDVATIRTPTDSTTTTTTTNNRSINNSACPLLATASPCSTTTPSSQLLSCVKSPATSLKSKRKHLRTKGTSLLANPHAAKNSSLSGVSSSPAKCSTSSDGHAIASAAVGPAAAATAGAIGSSAAGCAGPAAPLSRLLTLNHGTNKLPTLVLPIKYTATTTTSTIIHNTNHNRTLQPQLFSTTLSYSYSRSEQQHHHHHHHQPKATTTTTTTTNTILTRQQQMARCCLKLEHDYALP